MLIYRMLDYRLLAALAAVLEEKGFEKAGQKLGLSQSAISQRIRQLEEELGTILIIRDSPPRPSPTGELLHGHFRQVIALERDITGSPGKYSPPIFHPLTIAINADSLATWFLDAVLPLLQSLPITLDIRVRDQDQTVELIKSGEACACLSSQASPVVGCTVTALGAMEYRLCASPAYRERWFPAGFTADAAATAPVIHYDHDDQLQQQAIKRSIGDLNRSPPCYYLPSTEQIFAAVKAGLGYCMIPQVQAKSALTSGELIELNKAARTKVDLYWHQWQAAPKALAELGHAIKNKFKKLQDI
jgi:LysR family transcriptional regulator (chromosome initiation inhibitor)